MKQKLIKLLILVCVAALTFGMFTACDGGGVKYKVAFSTNGGSYVETIEVAEGGVIETEPVSTKDGYVFIGWYPSEKATEKVTFPYEVTANVLLYAKWEAAGAYEGYVTGNVIVGAYPHGPSADKIVLEFDQEVANGSLSASAFAVSNMIGDMETTAAYLSDENGEEVTDAQSKYVTLEINPYSAGAFLFYDTGKEGTVWADITTTTVSLREGSKLSIGGKEYEALAASRISFDEYIVPAYEGWKMDGYYTLGETVKYSTLGYAAYEPESLAGGEKNPLIVWLHGGGEGGSDLSIVLLGTELTAMARDEIQSCFVSGSQTGAYILAPQAPRTDVDGAGTAMWMDAGDGVEQHTMRSAYTDTLWTLIKQYVEENGDIDTDRIYVGGCSAGGFMTLNMMLDDTENYFAAAFPIALPYEYVGISEEQKEALATRAIWFTHSADDLTAPAANSNELYVDLINRGATNVFYSYFENVKYNGKSYSGHWSWIYVLRNECKYIQSTAVGITMDDLDPASTAVHPEYPTLWTWLAAQSN